MGVEIIRYYSKGNFRLLSVVQLNEDERTQLIADIDDLSEEWHEVDTKISPKFDALTMVVPLQLERLDGYTGALSEQSIEHLHSIVNGDARSSYGISNPADRALNTLKVI
jgi:hypothetical protein